jgi:circadian clock protein KaiB
MYISPEKGEGGGGQVFLRLFVAGDEPNSIKARQNLREFCASHPDVVFEVEVVDVLTSFKIALQNKIFLTPALTKVTPLPAVTCFGDLSNVGELADALGLRGNS